MSVGEMSKADKLKMLSKVTKKIQADNGGDTSVLSFAGERASELVYTFIPTTSERLNKALSGGFARGKIGEVAGENSAGKTSLLLETIGLDMKENPDSFWGWFDTEGDLTIDYAIAKGIDPDRFMIWEMGDIGAEKGLDTLEMLIRTKTLTGIVVNSVAGLAPKSELNSEMGHQGVAEQARMMSKLMRKIVAISNKTKTAVIFINQMRTDIMVKHGDNNTTTGGRALRFYATQRVRLTKVKVKKEEDGYKEDEAMKVNVKILKNRCAQDYPNKATSFLVLYGEGIDRVGELSQLAIDAEIVERGGAWIYYPSKAAPLVWDEDGVQTELKFGSQVKFKEFIKSAPTFQALLTKLLRESINVKLESMDEDEVNELAQLEKKDKEELGDPFVELEGA